MKSKNRAPSVLCAMMMIFSVAAGTFYPSPNFFAAWAGMWGVFTGITLADVISDDDDDYL